MAHLTITIEGTSEEVIRALEAVAGVVKQQGTQMVKQESATISWLPDEIRMFFRNLQEEAQRILREIATKPQGYNRDDLLAKLNISARGLAGRLSSVGHTLRRFYPMKPRPMDLDVSTWSYTMLPEFVDWIANNGATH